MTNRENDTEQPAQLFWNRPPQGRASTYYAEANGWKYTADQPSKGYWVLRGWGPDDAFLYRVGRSLKGAKAQADVHQGGVLAAAKQAAAVQPTVADPAPSEPMYAADKLIRRQAATAQLVGPVAPPPLRPCCYVSPCAPCHCGRPIGGCCYLSSEICPSHH